MYVLKNALKNITRSKGRSILIGIIVMVIAVACCISLSIKNAADSARDQGIEQLSITAQVTTDTEKLNAEAKDLETEAIMALYSKYMGLSLTEMQEYATLECVDEFVYTLATTMSAEGDITPYSSSGDTGSSGVISSGGQGEVGDFTVSGYSSEKAMIDFADSTSKITEGEMLDFDSDELTCIINNDLATLNNLEVGDTITFINPNTTEEEYTFTIVGIYTTTNLSMSAPHLLSMLEVANQIYTNYDVLKSVTDASAESATTTTDETTGTEYSTALTETVTGTYIFADVNAYESFQKGITEMGLDEHYTAVSTDVETYEESLVPLENLSDFAVTLFVIVLLIGSIILIVFNIFNIRERKYEVGVLTAIGMKKNKVALQFIIELFLVTFIAVTIGTAIGAVASVPVATGLLENQIAAMETQDETSDGTMTGGGQLSAGSSSISTSDDSDVDYIDAINAVVNFSVLIQLIGIGILITLISSAAGVIFVLRYEPLKILSERT